MTEHDEREERRRPFDDTGDWPFRDSAPSAPEPEPLPPPAHELDPPPAPLAADPEAAPGPLADRPPAGLGGGPAAESLEERFVGAEGVLAADERASVLDAEPVAGVATGEDGPQPDAAAGAVPVRAGSAPSPVEDGAAPEQAPPGPGAAEPASAEAEHLPGELRIPAGPDLLEGAPSGFRRSVAVVVSRFNAEITSAMLERAVESLTEANVARESITVVPVPGAFELPLAAMALAKTRRFSCIVALGCVIRGETPHFDFVAGEAASGLQLAALETGIPVSFGLLTCETKAQAEARIGRAADAVRAALEMADLFSHIRTRAARSG
ncbi:MAG TPA: 6,7-dimethyl-8-ribityllumazine synthase [Gaiellaceae bacterium]|nr:6,7-dimethyl-8-ribityllumazine synthase [Gaiellaceae bacterium]